MPGARLPWPGRGGLTPASLNEPAGYAQSSTGAVLEPPASPAFTVPRGSISAMRHSPSATGPVVHPPGDHVEVAGSERHGTVWELDEEPALEHQEGLVGLGMAVPDELALDAGHLDVVVIHARHDPGGP